MTQRDPSSLRVCYLNAQPKIVAVTQVTLELHLQELAALTINPIASLDDPAFSPCDLLVVSGVHVPQSDFVSWLRGFAHQMHQQGKVWVPAIFLADVPFRVMKQFMAEAHSMNWYFDILAPDHLSSLPIRVANLLRIHDHLHELKRYAETLDGLSLRVTTLASELDRMKRDRP